MTECDPGEPFNLRVAPFTNMPSTLVCARLQDVVKLPIQINGKVRATLEVQRDITQEAAVQVRVSCCCSLDLKQCTSNKASAYPCLQNGGATIWADLDGQTLTVEVSAGCLSKAPLRLLTS